MEKKTKKDFHQLSEDQLQEVTGGVIAGGYCLFDFISCPSGKFDNQCKCIE